MIHWGLPAMVVVASITLLAGRADALSIVGTSEGFFSGLSSCDNSGSSQNCGIVGTSNGPNTQVQWGSTSFFTNFKNPSTLTVIDVTMNAIPNANDVTIAKLNWFNNATLGQNDLENFVVNLTLGVAFAQPNVSGDGEVFNLTVTNTPNPLGDNITGFTLPDLSNLTFSLTGVTVSDLKYAVVDGPGGSGPNQTALSFSGGTGNWYNAENNDASLLITADFTSNPSASGFPVARPGTLMLLGGGLVAISAWNRRARRRR